MPVFNAIDTVERAARSILSQTLQDIELIVVDDGSTDGSGEIIERIGDPRTRIIRTPHLGVASAANTGTKLARAGLIARMDADDYAYPERIRLQLEFLESSGHDVVGCHVRILDDGGRVVPSLRRYQSWVNDETASSQQIHALRFVEFPLVNPTILARRAYFELGFRSHDVPEDYDLMLRAAGQGMRFGKVAKTLFDWHDHTGRLTRNDSHYSEAAFMRCRREHLLAGPLRDVSTVDLWGVGMTGKPWMRWLVSQGISIRHAYDVSPRRIGQNVHGTIVQDPQSLHHADGTPMLIAVGAADSRTLITPQLTARGYQSGKDAWFVA